LVENQTIEQTTEQETQQTEIEKETENILIEEVTKTQITSEAKQYIKAVEEKINDLQNQSKAALVIANEKSKQANEKQAEADKMIEDVENNSNESEKETKINTANKIEEEAKEAAKEAVAYFNISKQLDKEIAIRTNEIEAEKQLVEQIEELVKDDNIDAANQKLTEFNQAITNKTFLRPSSEVLKVQKQQDVQTKQNELELNETNIATIVREKDSLTTVAQNYRSEANSTEIQSEKSELISKAEVVESTINEKNEILRIANNNKNALNDEITALQSEINITSEAFAELDKPNVINQANVQEVVAETELAALEENINTYKTEDVFLEKTESGGEEIEATVTNEVIAQTQTEQTETQTEIISKNIETETNQEANQQNNEIVESAETDTNKISQTVEQTTIDPNAISSETKTSVVDEANTYINVYKNVADELSLQAKKALVVASQKTNLSNSKLREAEALNASIKDAPETQKESIQQRVVSLNDESVVLAREAVTAYNISKQLDAKSTEIQSENQLANQKLQDIIRLLDENNLQEANIKSNELKTGSEIVNSKVTVRDIIEVQNIQIANNKQEEADNVFAVAESFDNEAYSLEVEATKIREEASTIRRVSKRKKLIAEAEQKESDATAKRQMAMEQRNMGSQLQIEATALRTQIEYTSQYITQSESVSAVEQTMTESDVSNIDIAVLESNINTLKSKNVYADVYQPQTSEIAEQIEEEQTVNQQNNIESNQTEGETQTEAIADNQQNQNITTEQQTEKSVTKTKEIIEIPDIDKAYTKVQYYTKSANLVNAEIQILESKSANINDENLKIEYIDRIDGLRNMADSLQNLASEARAEVNLLRITQNAAITFTENQVGPDAYVKSLLSEVGSKNKEAQTLRENAETASNRNERNDLISMAENLEAEAIQTEVDAKEIEGISNQNKYLSNKVKIEQQKIEDPQNFKATLAKTEEQEADFYYNKAAEYRNTANANIAVNSKKSLLDEASSFERIALSKQQKALEIYIKENPNALIDETFIAQNTISKEETQTPISEEIAQNENVSNVQTQNVEVENEISDNKQQTAQTETESETETEVQTEAETEVQTEAETEVQTEAIATNEQTQQTTEQQNQEPDKKDVVVQENNQESSNEIISEIPAKAVTTIGVYMVQPNQAEARISAYNDNNPIPHNVELPSGLVYKVQIAAFRKEVSFDIFKGLAPITSEKAPNSDFTRYMAGIFSEYNPAISARDNIRQIGYRDAFVVAYFNGSRISIARARQLIQSGEAFTSAELASAVNITSSANSLYEAAQTTRPGTEVTTVEPKAVGDLFYSVQVGVYNTPRSSQQLFGIGNLFNDRLNNGYYRYFSGKYNSHNEAVPVRDNIRVRGVKDAFIVSFYNNNKISLTEARRIQTGAQPRSRTLELQTQEISKPIVETTVGTEGVQDAQQEQQTKEIQSESNQINYRIQIGAFKNKISVQQLNLFNRITNVEIQSYRNKSGLIIYTVGNFDNYNEALNYKNSIVSAGISGAFVTAFNGNKRIAVQQAIQLQQ
ncbi:SPOR domain-containing protein, partial [Bacteroidota bacterium]